jgi:hypothetical protein
VPRPIGSVSDRRCQPDDDSRSRVGPLLSVDGLICDGAGHHPCARYQAGDVRFSRKDSGDHGEILVTKKYDDAKWHYGGDFPSDLPPEAGATHIGMFFAWAILNGLGSEEGLMVGRKELLSLLRDRLLSPAQIFTRASDNKFLSDDLSDEGNTFAAAYYENSNGYIADYDEIFGGTLASLYHVNDSWENFDRLRPKLDSRLDEWRRGVLKL